MDDELFLRAFQEMFVCPDSRSPEELACEKVLSALQADPRFTLPAGVRPAEIRRNAGG